MPTSVASIRREHVESWIETLLERFRPATAAVRFRSLQQFRWLLAEGEIERDPMERMSAPRIPDEPPAILTQADLRGLVKACEGQDLEARRDQAIMFLSIDTGARLGEFAGTRLDDVDLDAGLIPVIGKGSKVRFLAIGATTVRALDRYLRRRGQHPAAKSPMLWLGSRGVRSRRAVSRRWSSAGAKQAGIGHVNVHRFRDAFAHNWLSSGGSKGDLEQLAGWSGPQMVRRYGCSAASARALESHRKLSPADRL